MKVLIKGEAHKHDKLIVDCDFCNTKVEFWRDEPGTVCDYVCTGSERWSIQYTCPVCGRDVLKIVGPYSEETDEGIIKDFVMSKEDKENLEEVMGWKAAED